MEDHVVEELAQLALLESPRRGSRRVEPNNFSPSSPSTLFVKGPAKDVVLAGHIAREKEERRRLRAATELNERSFRQREKTEELRRAAAHSCLRFDAHASSPDSPHASFEVRPPSVSSLDVSRMCGSPSRPTPRSQSARNRSLMDSMSLSKSPQSSPPVAGAKWSPPSSSESPRSKLTFGPPPPPPPLPPSSSSLGGPSRPREKKRWREPPHTFAEHSWLEEQVRDSFYTLSPQQQIDRNKRYWSRRDPLVEGFPLVKQVHCQRRGATVKGDHKAETCAVCGKKEANYTGLFTVTSEKPLDYTKSRLSRKEKQESARIKVKSDLGSFKHNSPAVISLRGLEPLY